MRISDWSSDVCSSDLRNDTLRHDEETAHSIEMGRSNRPYCATFEIASVRAREIARGINDSGILWHAQCPTWLPDPVRRRHGDHRACLRLAHGARRTERPRAGDRKSTRMNSSQ